MENENQPMNQIQVLDALAWAWLLLAGLSLIPEWLSMNMMMAGTAVTMIINVTS